MACFLAPLAAGIIVIALRRLARSASEVLRLDILSLVLIGGALLLVVEHIWHSELAPYPPFLTAMSSPEDLATALREISTAGVSMVLASAGLWSAVVGLEKVLTHRRVLAVSRAMPAQQTRG